MNRVAFLSQGVAAAYRARERIRRRGLTPNGKAVWTDEETETLRRLYPDYKAAMKSLGRSYSAVRNRSQMLGLTPKRKHWTSDQVTKLRRVYQSPASAEELRDAFPGKSPLAIQKMADYFGFKRPRRPFAPTGYLVIDQIRHRCFECNLSMVDLDEMAATRGYFAKAAWHAGGINPTKVAKAVKALGGELVVKWDQESSPEAPAVKPMPRLMPSGRLVSSRAVRTQLAA